jgi:mannose-6-phosphate isomerase-like protein (cupin superfamily)
MWYDPARFLLERDTMPGNVFPTTGLKRYRFPTHLNELVYDRAQARHSEVFLVGLEPGEAPPLHVHDDTEQVFYILEGRGTLTIGADRRTAPVKPGDVVHIPPATPHSIKADGGQPLRYLSVDCFGAGKPKEPTWDEHVRAVCRERGWSYDQVVGTTANKASPSHSGRRSGRKERVP